jgi:hypothetical protein
VVKLRLRGRLGGYRKCSTQDLYAHAILVERLRPYPPPHPVLPYQPRDVRWLDTNRERPWSRVGRAPGAFAQACVRSEQMTRACGLSATSRVEYARDPESLAAWLGRQLRTIVSQQVLMG